MAECEKSLIEYALDAANAYSEAIYKGEQLINLLNTPPKDKQSFFTIIDKSISENNLTDGFAWINQLIKYYNVPHNENINQTLNQLGILMYIAVTKNQEARIADLQQLKISFSIYKR